MEEPPSYDPATSIKNLLEQLLGELKRLSPEQYAAMVAPGFDANPVPDVSDNITWLGPEECLDVLYKFVVPTEEILEPIELEGFKALFLGKELSATRACISYLKISEWIFILKALRERTPRLIAKDAHLKNQLWLLFSDHQGQRLDQQSLRRLVSRCRVSSEKRQQVLEDIITAVHNEYHRLKRVR